MNKYERAKIKREKALAFQEKIRERRYSKHDSWKCRGGKPHSFVLVMPPFVKFDGTEEEYYAATDRHAKIYSEHLIGCEFGEKDCPFRYWNFRCERYYGCIVCHKTVHDSEKEPDYRIRNALVKF